MTKVRTQHATNDMIFYPDRAKPDDETISTTRKHHTHMKDDQFAFTDAQSWVSSTWDSLWGRNARPSHNLSLSTMPRKLFRTFLDDFGRVIPAQDSFGDMLQFQSQL